MSPCIHPVAIMNQLWLQGFLVSGKENIGKENIGKENEYTFFRKRKCRKRK